VGCSVSPIGTGNAVHQSAARFDHSRDKGRGFAQQSAPVLIRVETDVTSCGFGAGRPVPRAVASPRKPAFCQCLLLAVQELGWKREDLARTCHLCMVLRC